MATTSVLIKQLQDGLGSVDSVVEYQTNIVDDLEQVDDLSDLSKKNDNCLDVGISGINNVKDSIIKTFASVATISDTMNSAINCFTEAEGGNYSVNQDAWNTFLQASPLFTDEEKASFNNTDFTFYNTKTSFVNNMTREELQLLTDSKMEIVDKMMDSNLSDYYPSLEYRNRATWYNALKEKYLERGYSEEEAKDMALLEMAEREMQETGGTIVSGLTSSTITNMRGHFEIDNLDDLIAKYEQQGYTSEQARELANLEQDYYDAVDLVETSNDNWSVGTDTKALQELNATKAEFDAANAQQSSSSTTNNTGGRSYSGGGSANTSNSNSISYRTQSPATTPSPTNQTSTATKTITTPQVETNNVVDTQEPVNNTVTETQGTIKEPVVETPTTENNNSSNSQPVVEDNTPPTQSTTGIADNIEHITTNTKVPINQTNSTQSVAGSINSIVSGNDSIPTLDPETEPSVGPDATLPTLDAEEVINQGELTDVTELPSTLDVVSIDKDITPTTEVKTSAAPIALGLGATGLAAAAGIGGPKLVENYKKKHNSFSFINKEEDDSFDFPEEETEQQEEKQTSPEKFDPKSLLEEYE